MKFTIYSPRIGTLILAHVLCAPAAYGAEFLLPIPSEAQKHSTWCWAAVSTMAVNSMSVNNSPADNVPQVDQVEVAVLGKLGMEFSPQWVDWRTNDRFKKRLKKCRRNFSICDGGHDTLLVGLDRSRPTGNIALAPADFAHNFGELERPILVRWNYDTPESHAIAELPRAEHALIVTGYNNNDPAHPTLRIWDPWPVETSVPTVSKHERWIPYAFYVDPFNDLSQRAKAVHDMDDYDLRPVGATPTSRAPTARAATLIPVVDRTPKNGVPVLVSFDEALSGSSEARSRAVAEHVFYSEKGNPVQMHFEVGPTLPIVNVTTADLWKARKRPQDLLVERTAALIVPLLRADEVVDAIVLLNIEGRWRASGYPNLRISELTYDFWKEHRTSDRASRKFYVVAIPEQAAIFGASGFGDDAMLQSVDLAGKNGKQDGRKTLKGVLEGVHVTKGRGPVTHNSRSVETFN